jgi:phosphatidate cytidylyltransferase
LALNKEVFKTRALSAVFFVIIMLAGLLWNHWSFLLLFTIIHFGCWHEYLNLIEQIYKVTLHHFLRWGMMLVGFGMMLLFCGKAYHINGFALRESSCLALSLTGFVLMVIGIFQKNLFNLKAFSAAALGWLYISMSWGMMLGLRQHGMIFRGSQLFIDAGKVYPIILISSIWINDTMAYIVGSFIGKTPFSKISPKKTWEGTAGGAILCILVVGLVCAYAHFTFTSTPYPAKQGPFTISYNLGSAGFALATIAAIIGTAGDLLESKLKRLAGVKDSGTMMPGHGGFMDRFDSLLLATPFAWLYIQLILALANQA